MTPIEVILGYYRDSSPIIENKMEISMEHEMSTGIFMDYVSVLKTQ